MQTVIQWFRDLSKFNRILVSVLAATVSWLLISSFTTADNSKLVDLSSTESETNLDFMSQLKVHVAGEVEEPGLYQLEVGARVEDAIAAAGGMTSQAFEQSVNLARMVSDGEQIVVVAKGQIAQGGGSTFVSLNNATAEQLEGLPGVGPALAARILEHRNALGSFSDLEQLREVAGIGPKLFAKITPQLTL